MNYGDGFTDLNAIVTRDGGPGTPFSVLGNHTYTKLGANPVVVTVTDKSTTRPPPPPTMPVPISAIKRRPPSP